MKGMDSCSHLAFTVTCHVTAPVLDAGSREEGDGPQT